MISAGYILQRDAQNVNQGGETREQRSNTVDLRSLLSFARVKPLAGWSLSATALGASMALFQAGGEEVDAVSMAVAALSVVLMQYVAHPMNDIMDLELDRQAAIGSTGRVKPIVEGAVTVGEARWLTVALFVPIIMLLSWLIFFHPAMALPVGYGMVALIGYNHPSFRLAYHPFTEVYLSLPANALSVMVIAYVGSDMLTPAVILMSIVFGISSSAFFVSMMSMDAEADRAHGKMTTVATFPRLRWCTWYPAIGLAILVVGSPLLVDDLGVGTAVLMVGISALALISLAAIGHMVDARRLLHAASKGEGTEAFTGRCRLRQLYISIIFSIALSALFIMAR